MPNKILAFGFLGALLFTSASRGDDIDKKTMLTVHEALIVPGQVLQPGKYVMKLADSQSDRHIVQIFNEDQNQLIATIIAIPNQRTTPSNDTSLMYWETPAGPALRAWFFPGDAEGQEFAYPKETADRIVAANNGARVPVSNSTPPATEVAANRTPEPDNFAERAAPEPQPAPPPAAVPVAPAPVAAAQEDTTLLAQNQPPPANPVQPAKPAAQNAKELPATASPLGWVTALGIISLAGAFFVRRYAANS